MESIAITDPGIYWHFDPKVGRETPNLVQLVRVEGGLFVRSRDGLKLAAGMSGDFAGPLPPGVPVERRDPVTTWFMN